MSLLKLELDPRHATTRSRGHKGERGKVEVIVSTYDLGADTSLVCEGHRWEDPIAAKRKPITNSRDNTMRYSTKRKTHRRRYGGDVFFAFVRRRKRVQLIISK